MTAHWQPVDASIGKVLQDKNDRIVENVAWDSREPESLEQEGRHNGADAPEAVPEVDRKLLGRDPRHGEEQGPSRGGPQAAPCPPTKRATRRWRLRAVVQWRVQEHIIKRKRHTSHIIILIVPESALFLNRGVLE